MKRHMGLKPLNLVKVNETPQFGKMLADEVCYVHGSNSSSFPGLVRFRALLSMEEIDGTSWFDRNRLGSGERGYTCHHIYQNQPISQGVSMHYLQNFQESLSAYSYQGLTVGNYSVLYGFSRDVSINAKIVDHPLSKGGINIDFIKAIYVPHQYISKAKEALSLIPRLQQVVFPLLV